MSGSEFREFAENINEDARARTDSPTGTHFNNAFVDVFREYLVEDGIIDDVEPCYYRKNAARGHMEVYGYGLSDDGTVLDIVTAEHGWKADRMRKADVDRALRRARNFVDRCRSGLHRDMEETDEAYPMALRINEAWADLARVRIFLLTDARVTVESVPPSEIGDLRCTYELWDIARLHRLWASGRREEKTVVDLADFGGPLPCLPAVGDPDYDCLLAVLPGRFLAELYETHGARLLQRNVRAYLQARGKVNKDIGKTVRESPGRFLAYNNGVSATATSVVTEVGEDGSVSIVRLVDLQIVNGGQTTASLHHNWRNGADLSRIQVPAKITVVRESMLDELVPSISRYANSQNAIKEADFQANSPYHVELEHLSRAIWAPAPPGSTRETRWYYERVRGQYQVDLARKRTQKEKTDFKAFHPLSQRFGKTDVAKYEMTYMRRPHDVSLGAEKCFQKWTDEVVSGCGDLPDARHFRHLVAKAILFGHTRKIIQRLRLGGYLGPTAAYVVALLVDRCGDRVDLDDIWRRQGLPDWIADAVPELATEVIRPLLVDAPGSGNVTEWCKKVQCWERVRAADWSPTG
ncbi:AIPR family protein [Streptomyces fenghuangensis]